MKTKLVIIFGGNSPEHEGSLFSAFNMLRVVDLSKYDLLPVAVTKSGELWTGPIEEIIQKNEKFSLPNFHEEHSFTKLDLIIGGPKAFFKGADDFRFDPDVIFPLIHGRGGEDGSIYGLFQYANIPCVGSDILGSAIAMDKVVTKTLLAYAGIAVAKFELISCDDVKEVAYTQLVEQLGAPFFMKPVDSGSSIGLHKVHNETEYRAAAEDIKQYSPAILVEEFIDGREIECAVLGNDKPQVTAPGEVITNQEFYDHDTKMYKSENLKLEIPASIDKITLEQLQKIAITAYRTCRCRDLARIDFFLTADNKLYVNEINSMPGFADMSLYPRLWEYQGKSRQELLDDLVNLAVTRSSSV
jgi:D-alanine-D-alanine ligase